MRIGGLQKFSLIDYPEKIASVIFTQGCNFRCRYCHNPELVIPQEYCRGIPEEEVIEFLKTRKKYLSGVVVSGGEPTIQKDLVPFLGKLKRLGFSVKLDTNGSHPDVLKKLIDLQLIDYIAMDVKAPLSRYEEIAGVNFPVEDISESIGMIIHSGIKHEFRTTVVKHLCSKDDLNEIIPMIKGCKKYYLQRARVGEKMLLDKSLLKEEQYSEEDFNRIKQDLERKQLQSA